ncbi:MAG TPA: RagB/SusD family nutrient uptake outer membrane protein [Flavisolibacter sp.]|jgi:hypothetical protein
MKKLIIKDTLEIILRKTRISFRMFFACMATFFVTGCDDFVDTELPVSQLTETGVFESPTTANAAMVSIYAHLRDSGLLTGLPNGITNQMGHYADELTFYGDQENPTFSFYNNTLLASDPAVQGLWVSSYNVVYASNAVIEGVAASATLDTAMKSRLTGEAMFVRAMVHFYLLNLYGDIPYITTTDYSQNSIVTRLPSAEVYSRIITDLISAAALLPEEDFSGQRTRPNRYAANALLARVYLYASMWAEASNAASFVLNNNSLYALETDLNEVFLNTSSETIWQLIPANSANTNEGALFVFTAGPPPFTALSPALMSAFETGDIRQLLWTNAVSDGTTTWHHAFKYKENVGTGVSSEFSVMIRVAELYLIRAEARARQGELIGAKEDLNEIRNRAGLGDTDATTAEQLLAAILNERRVELFTELGHRFFDLKRFGVLDVVLSGVKPGWDPTDALLPIPESELLLNPGLGTQNPGY